MKRRNWSALVTKAILLMVPGSAILGTSCAGDIRKNLVAAGLGFVKDGAGSILDTAFPIDDWLSSN